jgi:hypothetical protein
MTEDSHNEKAAGGLQASAGSEYEVGYKKPPRHTRFKPGKSGNPGGRPKRAVNVVASMTKMLSEPVDIRVDGKPKKISTFDAYLLNLRNQMLKGDPQAFNAVIKLLNAAGMMKPVEDGAPDETLSAQDKEMLAQVLASLGTDKFGEERHV